MDDKPEVITLVVGLDTDEEVDNDVAVVARRALAEAVMEVLVESAEEMCRRCNIQTGEKNGIQVRANIEGSDPMGWDANLEAIHFAPRCPL